MNEIAKANDEFRKHGRHWVRLMVPDALPTLSPILGLSDKAIDLVGKFDFPPEDESSRAQGEVDVEGHKFRWEIGYQNPEDKDFSAKANSDERVLSVYVPTE